MQGPAHLAIGWLIGESASLDARRDRRIVGLSGLIPDIDVLAYPFAYVWFGADLDKAFAFFALVHHRYTHSVIFALLMAALAYRLATPAHRNLVAALTLLAVVTHIGGDIIASGTAWPVYPWWPFADVGWTVEWSWPASDWRNIALSFAALAITLIYSRLKGYSPLECFSFRADAWMAAVMRGEMQSTRRFRIVLYTALIVVTAVTVIPLWLYMR